MMKFKMSEFVSIFKFLNRCHSAADCSISLQFGTEFEHITRDELQTSNVEGQGSKVKVTA